MAQALVREGEPAVDALIACVRSDDRLTRSVWFGHPGSHWRYPYPTSRAAFDILQSILQTDRFGPATSNGFTSRTDRSAVADEVRAYRATGGSPAERWYATLADDAAGPDRWVEAAGRIAGPTVVFQTGPRVTVPGWRPGAGPPVNGEPLRAKRNPSVAELMAKRVPILAAENGGMWSAQSQGVDVALDLYRWDATAAVPVLRDELQRCMDAKGPLGQRVDDTARDIGRLTTALAGVGDADGPRRYAAWVVRQQPATAGHNVGDLFQPLWRNPDNPDLTAVAEALFNGPASPWRQVSAVPLLTDSGQPSLYASPMVGLPAFRRRVHRDLQDLTMIGSAQVDGGGLSVSIDQPHGGVATWGGVNRADPPLPRSQDEKVPVRTCDWCAWKMSQLDGAPAFELYWPQAKRDEHRAKLAAFLDRWGDQFRYATRQPAIGDPDPDAARMAFPRRDRPATADDVRRATAIFSLAGGPVRVVPLPAWPARAEWVTLKDYPVQYQGPSDPKTGVTEYRNDFLNDGLVWQAEEVQVDGKWQRFYGFVGPHTIAKVPADEIEFDKGP